MYLSGINFFKPLIHCQNAVKQTQQYPNGSICKNPTFKNCRYFESGYCTGLFQTMHNFLLEKCPQMRSCTVYPWRVYTQNDINMYSIIHPNTTSIPKQYKRKVLSSEKADMNKTPISLLLDGLKPRLLNHYSVVFVHKAYQNPTNPTHR